MLFPPTYKLYPMKNVYNITKKKRIPGWTDRILYLFMIFIAIKNFYRYKTKYPDGIQQINYDSIKDLFISDHRAVFGQFTVDFILDKKVNIHIFIYIYTLMGNFHDFFNYFNKY